MDVRVAISFRAVILRPITTPLNRILVLNVDTSRNQVANFPCPKSGTIPNSGARIWLDGAVVRMAYHRRKDLGLSRLYGVPHYFFDIHDGIHVTDNEGQELADLEAAKAEGIRIAGGFATRPTMLGSDGGAVNVVIRTEPNVTAMIIRLVFNVEIPHERVG